jgi:heme exporter protein C
MYVHVPAAWASFAAFAVVFVSSVLYLWRRDERHDLLAASAAEVGAVFTGLALALGSIWGRPTWGVWWAWDARLTSTAILLMIYAGYLALRAFTEDDDKRARWSAAVGILGFINVPVVYMSVQWWETLHQARSTLDTVDRAYAVGLGLNGLAFLFVLIYFAGSRYYTARAERAVEARLEERSLTEGAARV